VYGHSPLCMWWCLLRLPCYLNVLLHTTQVYSHSPRCTSWCMFIVQSVNDLLHISQVYGCSPLCLLWCIFRWHSTLNDLQHASQAYRHSPLYMCWCIFKIILLPEWLITHITGIQVLSTTDTLPSLHSTMLPECCITLITGSWITHIRYVLILIPSTWNFHKNKKYFPSSS